MTHYMPPRSRSRSRRGGCLALLLALLLLLLSPLGRFFRGFLPGGGREPDGGARQAPEERGLRVTVLRGRGGPPVGGARILVRRADGSALDLVADDAGVARLPPGEGRVSVSASEGGANAEEALDGAAGGELLLLLAPARDLLEGRVRASADAPARATVRLLDERAAILAECPTDTEGRYRLPRLPDAAAVCAEGGAGALAAAEEGDLSLADGEPTRFRIVGARASEVEVRALWTPPTSDRRLPLRGRVALDAEGAGEVSLPRGATGYVVAEGRAARLRPGAIELPERVAVSGRVRRFDGSPARGAVLLFRPLLDADFPAPLPETRVVAGDGGSFSASVPAGRHALEIRAPGCAAHFVDDFATGGAPLDAKLAPGFLARGKVLDAEGAPIPGALVTHVAGRAFAEEDGTFALDGLPGEEATLTASAAGFRPRAVAARAGTPVEIRLDPR